jgi:hypothetical protein
MKPEQRFSKGWDDYIESLEGFLTVQTHDSFENGRHCGAEETIVEACDILKRLLKDYGYAEAPIHHAIARILDLSKD